MRRFFLQRIEPVQGKVSITGQEARHIFKVLRMRPGDRLVLMDAQGMRFQAIVQKARVGEVIAEIEAPLPSPPESPVKITICQSLLKSRNMDLVIQKTSELGVDRICPFTSERTVVVLAKERLSGRMEHWQKIAAASSAQAGRRKPARIDSLRQFKDQLQKWGGKEACKLILWEEERCRNIKSVLRNLPRFNDFIGVVGPEGGFGPGEMEAAKNAGFIPVTLGHRILRSETAAIALTTIIQYECGDLGPDTNTNSG
jgi:16S rRNA (uracil1498-N3)-methyltransferase